jgi:predicted membrane chloride channel (bestrophin family)
MFELNENTTAEEISKFILEASEEEIAEVFGNENNDSYLLNLSDEAKDKINSQIKRTIIKCLQEIKSITRKGEYG